MHTLANGLDFVDLQFLGRPQIIATAVLQSAGGVALIDPGPATTLDGLLKMLSAQGIALRDVRQVLLTHIHLDHAGATGTLVKANPAIEVFVHERGARHLIDPAKLLASAARLYGADMDRLWGEFAPVPAGNVKILSETTRISAGGRELDVTPTPGHAMHHVTYFDRSSGVAFVGDVAGIRRGAGTYILPPTPPPDIDLELWRASADRILAWDPDTLFLTHFGPYRGARLHFQQLFERLDEWSALVKRLIADGSIDDAERERRFVEEALLHIRRAVGETEAQHYSRAGRLDYSWQGLARYWRRVLEAAG
ncbi:MAG TPA: MBL fold metallo-hydrolase [Vicinamibacterales bacterium]|jgi:glyoxylase-like metal-dependent hydrolase (beta-lactamase superfamily II)